MNDEQAAANIEAVLFAFGKPMSRVELSDSIGADVETIERAIEILQTRSHSGGIILVDDGTNIELRTAPTAAEMIERIRTKDLSGDIGKAGLEVLAAILYRGPVTRSEIDFMRGVNSSQVVRTLLQRGLIRKAQRGAEGRASKLEPTTELLAEMGISKLSEVPEYEQVREKLSVLEAAYRQTEQA